MTRNNCRFGAVLLLLACFPFTATSSTDRDVVVLIEPPTAAQNEASLSVSSVTTQLLQRLNESDFFGAISYRDGVNILRPLGEISNRQASTLPIIADEKLSTTAKSNTAIGLERAIYELRTGGRRTADKLLIVLGDGITREDEASRNDELEWVRNGLVQEAKSLGISIFWLTYSEAADYRLIQTITRDTGGDYFRAFTAGAARAAMDHILPSKQSAAPEPAQTTNPGEVSQPSNKHQILSLLAEHPGYLVAISSILLAGGAAIIIIFMRRRMNEHANTRGSGNTSKRVLLRDISHFTGMSEYDITGRTTYISRQPREVTHNSCIIVIRDTSVSRNHASIVCQEDGYWISDSGGVNGTYVNNERIQGNRLLKDGDQIRFAKFIFEFSSPQSLPAGRTVSPVSGDSNKAHGNEDLTVLRDGKR